MTEIISYRGDGKTWWIVYDGKRLGDSKAYDTAQQASDAAINEIDKHPGSVYRPGYLIAPKRFV